jgi:hypothetical protein
MKVTLKYKPEVAQHFWFQSKSKPKNSKPKTKRVWKNPLSKISIPEVKPLPLAIGAATFTLLAAIGIAIGATIGTYVFFGIATLAGFVAIAESNKWIRYGITKMRTWMDVVIFGLTIFATISLGTILTGALTIAGLGYTLVYAPYIRKRELLINNK